MESARSKAEPSQLAFPTCRGKRAEACRSTHSDELKRKACIDVPLVVQRRAAPSGPRRMALCLVPFGGIMLSLMSATFFYASNSYDI